MNRCECGSYADPYMNDVSVYLFVRSMFFWEERYTFSLGSADLDGRGFCSLDNHGCKPVVKEIGTDYHNFYVGDFSTKVQNMYKCTNLLMK